MKLVWLCIIAFVCVHTAKAQSLPTHYAPDPSESPAIKKALAIRDAGDLAYSADLLSFVIAHSDENSLIAEALYWLIDTGDIAAERLNARSALPPIKWNVDSLNATWSSRRKELNSQSIEILISSGLNVKLVHMIESFYVNDASEYFSELFTNYGDTKWAEIANAKYVWRIGSEWLSPKPVIEAGHAFLLKYPQSMYLQTVYSALGCAYEDEWNWDGGEEEARTNAIKYYTLAKEVATDEPSRSTYQRFIDELESKQLSTDACFFIP